ncbi:polyprenyl synthetase family protein [Nocardiopsis coralliicola]
MSTAAAAAETGRSAGAEQQEAVAYVTGHLDGFVRRHRGELARVDPDFAAEVVDRLHRFVLGGGKRTRPAFAWWGWRAAGGDPSGPRARAVLRAAAGLELVQAFALLQDDVMDGAQLRRGSAAVHVRFAQDHRAGRWRGDAARYGASAAILAADLALVWAEEMLTDALAPYPEALQRVRAPWRSLHSEMVVGQFLDLRTQARGDASVAAPMRINRLKTAAYSVERPLQIGAAAADAGTAVVRALRSYGALVGSAYQLRDDLLDLYGAPEQTGKPLGGDLREGKRTLIVAVGLREAGRRGDAEAAARIEAALGDAALTEDGVRAVARLLEGLGARSAVERRLAGLAERGVRSLDRVPITAAARDQLGRLARSAAVRAR